MKNLILKLVCVLPVALAACAQQLAGDAGDLASYSQSWEVMPAPDAGEQRIALPAGALVALRTPNLGDVRLFDGEGRSLPLALVSARPEPTETISVPSWQVRARNMPQGDGVALAIGPDGVARVVGVVGEKGAEREVAALIDTRKIIGPVVAVQLVASLPVQQPVTLSIAASTDLAVWQSLADKTLFRTDAAGNQLEETVLPLNRADLRDRYLKVTWDAPEGVAVTGAAVVVGRGDAPVVVRVQAAGARLESPMEVRLSRPGAHRARALVVALDGNEGVVPATLEARAHAEEPWQVVAAATLRSDRPASFELQPSPGTELRLMADTRTAGFSAPPVIAVHYAEVTLLARFSGKPPYRLAAGLENAPAALLAMRDILPEGSAANLPQATVATGDPAVIALNPQSRDGLLGKRSTILWLVLLTGVGGLAFAVLRLLRKAPAGPGPAEG